MNKKRLIDANALSEKLKNLPFGYAESFAGQAALREIEEAPTIYAVPVVRCERCVDYNPDCGYCEYWEVGRNFDDYCSRGKKRGTKDTNAPAKDLNKICPTNGAPCNECIPGSPCAKTEVQTDEIKRLLITCMELNMPPDVEHSAMYYALGRIERLERLEALVKQYIQKHNITCSESIWHLDKPQVDAIVLADELCKLVLEERH